MSQSAVSFHSTGWRPSAEACNHLVLEKQSAKKCSSPGNHKLTAAATVLEDTRRRLGNLLYSGKVMSCSVKNDAGLMLCSFAQEAQQIRQIL